MKVSCLLFLVTLPFLFDNKALNCLVVYAQTILTFRRELASVASYIHEQCQQKYGHKNVKGALYVVASCTFLSSFENLQVKQLL